MFMRLDLRWEAWIIVDLGFSLKIQGKTMRERERVCGKIRENEPKRLILAFILGVIWTG
jgi:hypothetical protein